MTIQDLGAIGDLLGGIAVVVTLIYLAAQIRQNTRINASLIRQNFYDATRRDATANHACSGVARVQ